MTPGWRTMLSKRPPTRSSQPPSRPGAPAQSGSRSESKRRRQGASKRTLTGACKRGLRAGAVEKEQQDLVLSINILDYNYYIFITISVIYFVFQSCLKCRE